MILCSVAAQRDPALFSDGCGSYDDGIYLQRDALLASSLPCFGDSLECMVHLSVQLILFFSLGYCGRKASALGRKFSECRDRL